MAIGRTHSFGSGLKSKILRMPLNETLNCMPTETPSSHIEMDVHNVDPDTCMPTDTPPSCVKLNVHNDDLELHDSPDIQFGYQEVMRQSTRPYMQPAWMRDFVCNSATLSPKSSNVACANKANTRFPCS
ncbi:hypothetical protein Salat_1195400 [Sesamum alatum]|uniref:Uncharacterized protein n=1 Tax=Sesamum alatum TaxID=300844 RepID=A0AAE1YF36_9LAMI|nr:hypothetical protein Salat_1195400 [Sesamum alatum]